MKTICRRFLWVAFIIPFITYAQHKADSLQNIIKTAGSDTVKVKALNQLFRELYFSGKTDSGLHLATYTSDLIDKLLDKNNLDDRTRRVLQVQKISATSNIGKIFLGVGNFPQALKYDTAALTLAKAINDKTSEAMAYGNLGSLYTCTGSYAEALNDELKALKLEEETNNKYLMASAYTNIGNIYKAEKNMDDALKNHYLCLKVSKELGFKQGEAWAYNNIGDIYAEQNKDKEALASYDSCLQASKAIGYKEGVAVSYANIGSIYTDQGNYNDALKNEEDAEKIYRDIGYAQYVANMVVAIAETYLKQKKYDEAKDNLQQGLDMSLKAGYREIAKQAYKDLSELYEELAKNGVSPAENWKKAHENYKNYFSVNDSLFNESTRKKSEQAQMQFEFDKKEATAKIEQDKKDALLAEEERRQTIIRNCLLVGFVLVLALAFLIFRGYRIKQKANVIISKQKDMVEQKNLIIETKNKAITDSLNYAQRIQKAMLPPEGELDKLFKEYFVLYKPKDIVSGDFYYLAPLSLPKGEIHDENKVPPSEGFREAAIIAVCDCTGHGVPGAFMSLIGSEKLGDALHKTNNTSEVLQILNKNIKTSLHQSAVMDSTRDGMDIALCSIAQRSNENNPVTLQFSGANRPLWIVRKGETIVEEVRPTKQSIGGFTDESTQFDSHTRHLNKGDAIYMFTDGYADQFGGKDGKKLTTKKFRELLVGISHKTMQEQKERLQNFLEEWKGSNEQVDDILLIGIRI